MGGVQPGAPWRGEEKAKVGSCRDGVIGQNDGASRRLGKGEKCQSGLVAAKKDRSAAPAGADRGGLTARS
jgi:hypothetical protein